MSLGISGLRLSFVDLVLFHGYLSAIPGKYYVMFGMKEKICYVRNEKLMLGVNVCVGRAVCSVSGFMGYRQQYSSVCVAVKFVFHSYSYINKLYSGRYV